ncbi:hypothetical protein CHS0354_034651, partial [Potamilus streckersoni]
MTTKEDAYNESNYKIKSSAPKGYYRILRHMQDHHQIVFTTRGKPIPRRQERLHP